SAPLPSYDLEEVSAGDAMGLPMPQRAFAASQLDDPFAEARLPSFDFDDDEATRYARRPAGVPAPRQSARAGAPPEAARPAAPPRAEDVPSDPSAVGQLDEEALEEVEFFASNNMFDEARNLLEAELTRLPNHPLLLERLRELDEHAA